MADQTSKNLGAWIGFAGTILAALITVAAMLYLAPDTPPDYDPPEPPTPDPQPVYELEFVFDTAAVSTAGTDSDIAIEITTKTNERLSFTFDGNDGFSPGRLTDKDEILEEGRSNQSEAFPIPSDLEISSLRLKLVHPDMPKSNWIWSDISLNIIRDRRSIRSYCTTQGGELSRSAATKTVMIRSC
ncbi:MAG: hypothetical protein AAGK79_19800 [Pseudomonadota bacterium]